MNIVLAGIMGRYPYGGVAWCSLMYLLGLERLGHRVWYLEDTGEWNFDPVGNTLSRDPDHALRFIQECLTPYGLGESWCYVDWQGGYHGHSREQWLRVCSNADLFLNLSGGCWFWRDEYAAIPHSAFIDSDPAFTQFDIARLGPSHEAFFARFGSLFTFGSNLGTPECEVPTGGLTWHHTWQPVCIDEWQPTGQAPRSCFTTVMSWQIDSFKDIGGNKDREFMKVLDLPSMLSVPACLEVAVSGPDGVERLLRSHGWASLDAFEISHDLLSYRDYIRSSLGEFSVAKHTYVRTNSGWFSDRTECYLASGRPAVVQDTGFSRHLPTGEGLLTFHTVQEAKAALDEVLSNYTAHARVAREVASGHFASEVVLPPLLEQATARPGARGAGV